jgi:hypothetical protein
METIFSANQILQYTEAPLVLPWRRVQTIVIRDEPWFDPAEFQATYPFYTLESDGSLVFSVQPGELADDDVVVNELYGLRMRYFRSGKGRERGGQWRITIELVPQVLEKDFCRTMDVDVVIPQIAVSHDTGFLLQCRFKALGEAQFVESLLAIDIGNTRSSALLCEDVSNVTHHNCMKLQKLPLFSYTDHCVHDVGVFDSYLSLSRGEMISFARVGNEAFTVSRILRESPNAGDFFLSSPKRYFWDGDPNAHGWKVLTANNLSTSLSACPVAEKIAFRMGQGGEEDPAKLSRASMLSAMLLELLEQAEEYLNSESSLAGQVNLPRVISHVCVTYPAGWSEEERLQYKAILQKALDVYQSMRCGAYPPIALDVDCDEATAVLLCFLYGEIGKYSGHVDTWLRTVGRVPKGGGGTQLRVAVIDVGGGTSDLAVINVQNGAHAGMLDLQIDNLYKDGTSEAGDLLLQRVVENILVKKLARATISVSAPRSICESYVEQFERRLNSLVSSDYVVRMLTRSFWFPLAIRFVNAVNKGRDHVELPDTHRVLLEVLRKHSEWSDDNIVSSMESLEVTDEDRTLLGREIVKTFRRTAKLFGAAISAFDADLVVLSGKTTEIPQVQRIFKQFCYLPERRFVPMWNYYIGDWCSIADGGVIMDSKYTTVLGAILCDVLNNNFPIQAMEGAVEIRNCLGEGERKSLWGILSNGDFSVNDAILRPGRSECRITMQGGRTKLLGHRRFAVEDSEVAVNYELRMKPLERRRQEWKALCAANSQRRQLFVVTFGENVDLEPDEFLILWDSQRRPDSEVSVQIALDDATDSGVRYVLRNIMGLCDDGRSVTRNDLQLRLRPDGKNVRGNVEVNLRLAVDGKIVVDDVRGVYENGAPVYKDDLEIRVRTSTEETFWLDSGRI